MYGKTMSAAAGAVLFSLVAIDGAAAEGGCGPGIHRNEFGRIELQKRMGDAPSNPPAGSKKVGRKAFWIATGNVLGEFSS
jgi:hypothetical protein